MPYNADPKGGTGHSAVSTTGWMIRNIVVRFVANVRDFIVLQKKKTDRIRRPPSVILKKTPGAIALGEKAAGA